MLTEQVEVRRSRRLVVSSIHTVGNYEYGFFWYFHLDGSIKLEIKLTGILTTRSHRDGDDLTDVRGYALVRSPEGVAKREPSHRMRDDVNGVA